MCPVREREGVGGGRGLPLDDADAVAGVKSFL